MQHKYLNFNIFLKHINLQHFHFCLLQRCQTILDDFIVTVHIILYERSYFLFMIFNIIKRVKNDEIINDYYFCMDTYELYILQIRWNHLHTHIHAYINRRVHWSMKLMLKIKTFIFFFKPVLASCRKRSKESQNAL